jgi:protein TonB
MQVRATIRERRAEKRASRKHRVRAASGAPISASIRAHDPLIERKPEWFLKAGWVFGIAVLAVVVHGAILVLFFGANNLMRMLQTEPVREDITPIEVAVVEPPPPPEPEKEPPPEEEKPEPKPIEKKEVRAPVADPIDKPENPPPEEAEKPQEIVGLSLESTVEGGGGVHFGVGNTRMGTTERVAQSPDEPKPLPKNEAPPKTKAVNRVATRVPKAGVSFKKPDRKNPVTPKYPERLRQRGIEGDVVVRVTISPLGRVKDVEIVSPAADAEFNEAAKAAALEEEFEPATQDGKPIEYALTYTVRFRLND